MPGVLKFIIVTLWYEARLVTHCQNVYFIKKNICVFLDVATFLDISENILSTLLLNCYYVLTSPSSDFLPF